MILCNCGTHFNTIEEWHPHVLALTTAERAELRRWLQAQLAIVEWAEIEVPPNSPEKDSLK